MSETNTPAEAPQVGRAHGEDRHALSLPQLAHAIYLHHVVLLLGRWVIRFQDGAPGQGVATPLAQHLLLLIWAQLHAHTCVHVSIPALDRKTRVQDRGSMIHAVEVCVQMQ